MDMTPESFFCRSLPEALALSKLDPPVLVFVDPACARLVET